MLYIPLFILLIVVNTLYTSFIKAFITAQRIFEGKAYVYMLEYYVQYRIHMSVYFLWRVEILIING